MSKLTYFWIPKRPPNTPWLFNILDDALDDSAIDDVPLEVKVADTYYKPLKNDTGINEGVNNEGVDIDTETDSFSDADALYEGNESNDDDDPPVDKDPPVSSPSGLPK